MPSFKTGRSRVLTITCGLAGAIKYDYYLAFGPNGGKPNDASIAISCALGSIGASGGNDANVALDPHMYVWTPSWSVTATSALGATQTTIRQDTYYDPADPTVWDLTNIGGTATFTAPIDEWVDITFGAWNGLEAPEITSVRVYEKLQPGGTLTVSITSGGVTASASNAITSGNAFIVSYDVGHNLYVHAADSAFGLSGGADTVSATTVFNTLGTMSAPYSKSVTGASATGAPSVHVDAPPSLMTYTAQVDITLSPSRSYSLAGDVRTWTSGYANTLGLWVNRFHLNSDGASGEIGAALSKISAGGGSFSDNYTQNKYTCAANLNGVAQATLTLDEWANMKITARAGVIDDGDANSLLALGEDFRDTRVLIRGFHFNSFSVIQNAATTVDTCSSLTPSGQPYAGVWIGVDHATVTLSAGIRAVIAGGVGKIQRTFTPRLGGFSGYAVLKIYVEADSDGSPLHVRIGSKVWTKSYSGAALVANIAPGGYMLIDLCSPSSETANTDATDTKWPLPTVDGPYWGVTSADIITFEALQNGVTYTFKKLELVHTPSLGHSQLTFLPSFDNWVLEVPPIVSGDITTTNYALLGLDGDTDGRRSVEELYVRKTVVETSTVTTISYADIPLKLWIVILGNDAGNPDNQPNPPHAGWVATANAALATTDPSDGGLLTDWLNNNRPSVWAWGGGALFGPGLTTLGINRGANSALTVHAQMLFDTLDWYPNCGDIFNVDGGQTEGPIQVRAAYFLRGQGWGYVLADAGRVDAASVSAIDTSDSSNAGGTTTNAIGEYLTDTPFGRGLHNIRVGVGGNVYDRAWTNRHRWRLSLRTVVPGKDISYDVSIAQRHYRAYVRGGTIRLGTSPVALAITWDDIDTGLSGRLPCVRVNRQSMEQRVYMSYRDTESGAGNILLQYTRDEGSTWSMPVTVTSDGTAETFCITPDGRKCIYWRTNSGSIRGIVYDVRDNAIVPEFEVIASGVEDKGLTCRDRPGEGGLYFIHLAYWSGGSLVHKNSQNGIDFT